MTAELKGQSSGPLEPVLFETMLDNHRQCRVVMWVCPGGQASLALWLSLSTLGAHMTVGKELSGCPDNETNGCTTVTHDTKIPQRGCLTCITHRTAHSAQHGLY